MNSLIDDAMVEVACKAVGASKQKWMQLALEAALPMIGEKLAKECEGRTTSSAARIRELTGAKP